MQILIAIVTGILAGLNYMWRINATDSSLQTLSLIAQIILTVITLIMLLSYKGRRSRPSHEHNGTRIFTLGFGLIVLSALGNVCVLVVMALRTAGVIHGV